LTVNFRYRLSAVQLKPRLWCTGKDSNLRTSLGGTDLQSVGFNHSPTCANPETSDKQHTAVAGHFVNSGNGLRDSSPDNYTRRKLLDGVQYYECVITCCAAHFARTAVFPEIILWSWRRDLNP
jgi:hypothetical protein